MAQIPATRGNPQASEIAVQTALPMVGSLSREDLQATLGLADAEIAKLFEDRNTMLQNGGIITFTGTDIQFTENIEVAINQKISGAAPMIISLGSATVTLANNEIWYAIIDRTAGTATTAIASTLPAVTSVNQEIFLIVKRVDAGDGTQRIYFRNGTALNVGQSVRLGSSGSGGSGNGIGDDLASLQFKASFTDDFSDIPTGTMSAINTAAGFTDATTYSAANTYFRLAYDATRTVTGTGNAMSMSGAPSFTVKIGDILRFGAEARRITFVTSQTVYTIESAFTTDPVAAAATVSQAVYTKDLNNTAGNGLAISSAFSTTINQILTSYEDTTTSGDTIFDINTTPVIAYTASSDNTSFTDVSLRPTLITSSIDVLNLPTASTSLYLRFFANNTTGSGFVNVLGYKTFLHKDATYLDGQLGNQSYGFTDNTGTAVNMTSISTVSGKTRIVLPWSFPVGVNPTTTNGPLEVYLNGQKIPRFLNSTLTPDASYTEVNQNIVDLDQDYSTQNLSIEINQTVAVADTSDVNTTNISQIQETFQKGFQNFVDTTPTMVATTTPGTPVAGSFYSTIVNRKAMLDMSNDLGARMGIDRVMTQVITAIEDEFGPNGEKVFRAVNDTADRTRFVGNWSSIAGVAGQYAFNGNSSGAYVEITFYGTGLNLLVNAYGTAQSYLISVDGNTETALVTPTYSGILDIRNYSSNQPLSISTNLTLGVHTVRIKANSASFNMAVTGFEILNESTNIITTSGSAYIQGKKATLAANSLVNFATGVTGTRGGRMVTYLNQDGTIGRAFRAVGAQANLASADHTNEEVVRTHYIREFGAARADDFSTLAATSSNRAFTLDDGTTTLAGANVLFSANSHILSINDNSGFITITFVGTGLDVINGAGGGITLGAIIVDGTSIGNYARTTNDGETRKIVSGLPYGTHTVRFTMTAGGGSYFSGFKIYSPKKPSIPSGSIELADYNVMADYSRVATSSVDGLSIGVLRKAAAREMVYVGTWSYDAISTSIIDPNAQSVRTAVNGDYFEYTFFGTGFDVLLRSGAVATTCSLTIDGVSYTGSANVTQGSWNPGTSTYTTATTVGGRLQVTGLSLAKHRIRITKNTATDTLVFSGMDIITPIHSTKSNINYDQQNTLMVGSQGLSDNRALTPVKDLSVQAKNISQAFGVTNQTTTSTVGIPMPDMSITHINKTGKIKVSYSVEYQHSTLGGIGYTNIVINGANFNVSRFSQAYAASAYFTVSHSIVAPVAIGTNRVEIFWYTNVGTLTAWGDCRVVTVEDV